MSRRSKELKAVFRETQKVLDILHSGSCAVIESKRGLRYLVYSVMKKYGGALVLKALHINVTDDVRFFYDGSHGPYEHILTVEFTQEMMFPNHVQAIYNAYEDCLEELLVSDNPHVREAVIARLSGEVLDRLLAVRQWAWGSLGTNLITEYCTRSSDSSHYYEDEADTEAVDEEGIQRQSSFFANVIDKYKATAQTQAKQSIIEALQVVVDIGKLCTHRCESIEYPVSRF